MLKKKPWMAALLLISSVILASCGDDKDDNRNGGVPAPGAPGNVPAGPIDGTWRVVGASCDGESVALPDLPLNITILNDSFRTAISNGAGCTVTFSANALYPSDGQVTVTDVGSPTCSVEGCDPVCSETPDTEPENISYVLSGNTLTLSSTALEEDSFCQVGQETQLTLEKQS